MLSCVRSVKHFFRNALSRAHRGVLVPTSLWLGSIDSGFIFKGKAWNENSFDNFSLQPTAALVRHALKFARLLSIHFVQVITEPCGSVVLS